MNNRISPKYQMELIDSIERAIWVKYASYKKVELYIRKWHTVDGNQWETWENFSIKKEKGNIDLLSTLHGIDGETLLKIAIDLGIETPDFIPSIPTFRNEIKSSYETASATFEKAFQQVEEHPDIAIGLANSSLESIIKEILKDSRIKVKLDTNKTLYKLTEDLLKEFQMFPNSGMPVEIKTIGSSLLNINQSIEKIRSEKTNLHGKTDEDYYVKDSLYTYFVVNSVCTVGLFLKSFYIKKYPKNEVTKDIEVDVDDIF